MTREIQKTGDENLDPVAPLLVGKTPRKLYYLVYILKERLSHIRTRKLLKISLLFIHVVFTTPV